MTHSFSGKINQLVIVLLVAVATVAAQDATPWQTIRDPQGVFQVRMPGAATAKVDSIETAMGTAAYHVFFYQEPNEQADNLFYMLSYTDYPDSTFHADSTAFIQEFFQSTVDAATLSVEGKLIYENADNWRQYPGYRWRIQYLDDQAVIKTRAFLVGDRYYALQTISIVQRAVNEGTDRFFRSFKLL